MNFWEEREGSWLEWTRSDRLGTKSHRPIFTISTRRQKKKDDSTYNHEVGEAWVERLSRVQEGDLLVGQTDIERFNVGHDLLWLPASDDWEDEGSFVHHICDGN